MFVTYDLRFVIYGSKWEENLWRLIVRKTSSLICAQDRVSLADEIKNQLMLAISQQGVCQDLNIYYFLCISLISIHLNWSILIINQIAIWLVPRKQIANRNQNKRIN